MTERTTPADAHSLLRWVEVLAERMVHRSSLSTVVYDREGHVVYVNPAFERMWGVALEDAPADYTVFSDPELLRQDVVPAIRRAFEGETVVTPPVCYDIRRVAPNSNGRTMWSQGHLFPVLDANGRVALVVLMHVDMTEQKETENELRCALLELEQLHRLTGELATVVTTEEVAKVVLERARPAFGAAGGFISVIIDGINEFANIGSVGFDDYDMTDYMRFPISAETPSGQSVLKGEPVFVSSLEEVRDHYPWIYEPLRASGFVSVAALPLIAHGHPFGAVAFHFRNEMNFDERMRETMLAFAGQGGIALERARLYKAERQARLDAENANRAKAEFLASLSHELRTPLNAIDAYAELLDMGVRGPLNDAQRADIMRIRRSRNHLLSLVDDVLSFARIEAGRIELQPRDVSVEEAISGALDLILPQIEARPMKLVRESAALDLRLHADPEKLRKILLNVLSNTLMLSDDAEIRIAVRDTSGSVAIEISSSGLTLGADRLAQVFEPFVPMTKAGVVRDRPVGLGLAIARDLARRMRGDITVSPLPGGGSAFTLMMPAARR